MKKPMKGTLASVLILAALAAQSGTVLAGIVDETTVRAGAEEARTMRIQFTRSELASIEGRAALQHRIERAAKYVCGPLGAREAGGLRLAARNRQCYTNAVDSALSQLQFEKLAVMN